MGEVTESTDQKQLKPWLFQPGQSGNPAGRPKGSRQKLADSFVAALHDDFQEHGTAAIRKLREEKTDAYAKVIAAVIPKQLEVDGSTLSQFNAEQLAHLIAALDAWIAANGGAGAPEAIGREQVGALPAVH